MMGMYTDCPIYEYDVPIDVVVYNIFYSSIIHGQIVGFDNMWKGRMVLRCPEITLDDGSTIFGNECIWAPSSEIDDFEKHLILAGYRR